MFMTIKGPPASRVLLLALAFGIIFIGVAAVKTDPEPSMVDQIDRTNQLYGTTITYGEYLRIVNPGKLEILRQNTDPETFERFCNQTVYWGNDYPSLPYGATIWKENGPLNAGALNVTEKKRYGIENAVISSDGYRIVGSLNWHIKKGESLSFRRSLPEGLDTVTCDLTWLNPASSLKIMIFGPDGMMGPYYDSSDGKENGRIFLQISRDRKLTGGDWYVVIDAEKTDGETQPFRLLFY
jgi:hypothetical protein